MNSEKLRADRSLGALFVGAALFVIDQIDFMGMAIAVLGAGS